MNQTTLTPEVSKVSLYLKSVVIKNDIYDQLADTFIEYMTCELAGVKVEIRGCVLKADIAENSAFIPVKATDATGRYGFHQYCEKMGWDYQATTAELAKAYNVEMHN